MKTHTWTPGPNLQPRLVIDSRNNYSIAGPQTHSDAWMACREAHGLAPWEYRGFFLGTYGTKAEAMTACERDAAERSATSAPELTQSP